MRHDSTVTTGRRNDQSINRPILDIRRLSLNPPGAFRKPRGSGILLIWMTASKSSSSAPDREKRRQAEKAQRHSERRLNILRSAKELLVTQGIERFTVAEVAQASQLSKPSLYYYFESKEALVFDLAIGAFELEYCAIAETVHAADSGVAALVDLVRTRVDHFLHDNDAFRILHVWAPALGLQNQIARSNTNKLMNALLEEIGARLNSERNGSSRMARNDAQQLPAMAWAMSQGILVQGISAAMTPKDVEQCRTMRDIACRWLLDSLV